jgi:hypothetical protein
VGANIFGQCVAISMSLLVLGDARDVHTPAGIEIMVSDKNNLRDEQKISVDAFTKATLKFDLIQDSLPPPAGTMMIKVNPAAP